MSEVAMPNSFGIPATFCQKKISLWPKVFYLDYGEPLAAAPHLYLLQPVRANYIAREKLVHRGMEVG